MFVHPSNRGEPLVGALADIVRQPLASPLTPECIVVQSRGIERWLGNELAARLGVWCNADFCYPRRLIERLTRANGDEAHGATDDALFEPETMTWSIAALLESPLLDDPRCEPLRRYLADDDDRRRRLSLAERVANVFDHYQVYRRDLLLAHWEQGGGDHWQSVLWRALVERAGSNGPFGERLSTWRTTPSPPPPADFPRRVSVFGLSTLPPAFLQVLAGLSRHIDVHLFLLSPTREYWGDVKRRDSVSFALTSPDAPDESESSRGHRLLGALGQVGREFHAALEQVGYRDGPYKLFVDPGQHSALAVLQSDMLTLRERTGGKDRVALSDTDESIRVHVCHSRLREVQVVYDQLRHRFETDGTLQPRDVVVLAPEIEPYAPYIDAVFGSTTESGIPYQVADRPFTRNSGLEPAFFGLVDTLTGRLSAPEVVDLLGHGTIASRFALDEHDVHRLRALIRESGVRWGIDADDRRRAGVAEDRLNTWRFGLDRLLYGHAVSSDHAQLGDVVALPYVEGDVARIVGQLGMFIDMLERFARRLAVPRAASEWAALLTELLDAAFSVDGDDQRAADRIVTAIAELGTRSELAGCTTAFSFAAIIEQLTRLVGRDVPTQPFLAGGVTFCRLTPMRSVPFRVVVVMGLGDDDFPRTRRTASFDLIAKRPAPGDRSARQDDRYLFLEAVLAAREALILTYPGRSPFDTRERPPSTVLAELLDTLDATLMVPGRSRDRLAVRERLTVEHALHPFAPEYFRGDDPRRFTYGTRYGRAPARRREVPPFCPLAPITLPISLRPSDHGDLELGSLLEFYGNPARAFLRDTLGIRLGHVEERLEAFEPTQLDPLTRWSVGAAVLDAVQAQVDRDRDAARLRGTGHLPPGAFGQLAYLDARVAAEAIAATGSADAATGVRPRRFHLPIGDIALVGSLPLRDDGRLVAHQFSRLSGASELRWWMLHLVASALGWLQGPSLLVGRAQSGHAVAQASFRVVDDAHDRLRELLAWAQIGATTPLPFFPKTSRAAAEQLNGGKSRSGFVDEFERGDAHVQLAFRGRQPWPDRLDSEAANAPLDSLEDPSWFVHLARVVYGPLLAARASNA